MSSEAIRSASLPVESCRGQSGGEHAPEQPTGVAANPTADDRQGEHQNRRNYRCLRKAERRCVHASTDREHINNTKSHALPDKDQARHDEQRPIPQLIRVIEGSRDTLCPSRDKLYVKNLDEECD
jgi:hypothetical protein